MDNNGNLSKEQQKIGMLPEIKNKYNTVNFDPAKLQGGEARLYNEFGPQIYHNASKQTNEEIAVYNSARQENHDFYSKIMTPEELETFYELDPETQSQLKENLYKGGDKANVALTSIQGLTKFNKEKKASAKGEMLQLNGMSMEALQEAVAWAEKTGAHQGIDHKLFQASEISKAYNENVKYDEQTNSFYVMDKFNQPHLIEPSFRQQLEPVIYDITGQVAAGLGIAWKISNYVPGWGWAKKAALYGAGEVVAGALPGALDTDGKMSFSTMTLFDQIYAGGKYLLGLSSKEELNQRAKELNALENFASVVGYPDQSHNMAQDAAYNVIGAGIGYGAFKTAEGFIKAPGAIKDVAGKIKPTEAFNNLGYNLDRANPFNIKENIKEKVKRSMQPMEKVVNDQFKQEAVRSVKDMTNDTTLTTNNAIAKGRELLKQAGVQNVDDMSDTGIAMLLVATNKTTNARFLKNIENNLSTDEITWLRDMAATNGQNMLKVFKQIATDKLDNSTVSNMFTNFKQVRNDAHIAINQITGSYGQEIKIPSSITKILPELYQADGKRITTPLNGTMNQQQWQAHELSKANNSANYRPSISATFTLSNNKFNQFENNEIVTTVSDLMKVRADIQMNRELLKNAGKTDKEINKYIETIDNTFKNAKYFDDNNKTMNSLYNKTFIQDLALIDDQMKFIKQFDTINAIYKAKNSLIGATKQDKSTMLANITKEMLTNASDLPDLNTFAKMLSPTGASKESVMQLQKDLEENMVKHFIDKPFTNETRVGDIREVLKWFGENSNNLKSPKAKAIADYANISLRMAERYWDIATTIDATGKAIGTINAGLSTNITRSLLIRLNTWQLQRGAGFLGKFLRSDVATEKFASKAMANFLAKPLEVAAPKSLQDTLNKGVKANKISAQDARNLATEAGEYAGQTKYTQEYLDAMEHGKFSDEVLQQMNTMSDAELQTFIVSGQFKQFIQE